MVFSQHVQNTFLFFLTFLIFTLLQGALLSGQTETQTPTTASASSSQSGQLPPKEQPGVKVQGKTEQGEDKRVLGVLPNYRTAEMSAEAQPLTAKQKLTIATKDSFDYPLVILGGVYAALYQLEDSHPEFGQGAKGYFSRLGTSYSDQVIGNMMTEGFMPVLLHEDPRYFRKAEGSKKSRTVYALTRIFVTRTDGGQTSFNYSEIVGNGIAAGIGLSYYPDDRNVGGLMENWGLALGTDATSQVLREFWPDAKHWWKARHHEDTQNP